MNSLCSDLQGKALQNCCVFCLCSQPRQNVSVYNRGITVALWRIILINWRRSSPGVCGEWLFDPFTYGDQPTDWEKGEFVSKTPRYRLAADYKFTEPWIFPRFSNSAAPGSFCLWPLERPDRVFICWLSIQLTTKLHNLKYFCFLPSQTGPERHVYHLVLLITF